MKDHPTPPAPQNRIKRARFFMRTAEETHSKAELMKLAMAQEINKMFLPKKRR